jgi:hypothetical protein
MSSRDKYDEEAEIDPMKSLDGLTISFLFILMIIAFIILMVMTWD